MKIFIKKHKIILSLSLLCIVAATITFVTLRLIPNDIDQTIKVPEKGEFDKDSIKDIPELYMKDDLYKVYEIYVTAYTGTDEKSGKNFDIDSMNDIHRFDYDPILQASSYVLDPSTGNIVGGDKKEGFNSTISLRGQSARNSDQKSYKVKLSDYASSFSGQRVLNLNKHAADYSTRMAQKLCFDSMKDISGMISLRTYFFTVYIKNGSVDGSEYVNYGLFTCTEQPNKSFLRAHGLDPNGSLYKPQDFEFFEDECIVPTTDANFKPEDFKALLKIRENPDNDKLAKMLSELNAENGDFNAVFEKYFDEENYLTWCAINILFNNYDTMSRNFLLYSPSSSDKWYFLPWDYDASLIVEDKWKKNIYNAFFGIGRYWGTPLHKKYFLDPENVEKLTKKIDDVYKQLMQKPWSEIGKNYYDIALKKIFTSVDKEYFLSHQTIDGFIYDVNSFDKTITYYYNLFYQSLEKPMPIFLGKPTQNDDGTIQFNWSPSYDLQSDRIFYDFAVYTNIDDRENTAVFSDHLSVAKKNLSIDLLPDGIYYWDANPVDSKGNTQSGFDRLRIKEFETEKYSYFGIKRFKMVNGKIEFFE